MQTKVQIFESPEFGKVRVIEKDGQPWFVGLEIAGALGYKNVSAALAKHLALEDKGITKHDTLGGKQHVLIINESGLYSLILSSKLPRAKMFKRWVTSEILPSIRKFGAYITPEVLEQMQNDPDFTNALLKRLAAEQAKNQTLTEYVGILQPKARYYDAVLQCPRTLPVSLIAKDYGMTAQRFNVLLHTFRIQYKVRDAWVLYKAFENMGYTVSRTQLINGERVTVHTQWTQKGRRFLYAELERYGIFPQTQKAPVEQIIMEGM